MKILILGFSRSGKGAYELLKSDNECYIYDKKHLELSNYYSYDKLRKELPFFDLIVRSPGIKITSKVYQLCLQLTNNMISEIELGLRYLKDNFIIGVTGSNGKTTLVKMIYSILKTKYNSHLLGNVGDSLTCNLNKIKKGDIVILELSSFQLENIYSNSFNIGVITNISDNHFDSVFSKESYIASKLKLFYLSNKCYLNDDSLKYIKPQQNVIKIESLKNLVNTNLNKYNQIYWNIACNIAKELNIEEDVIESVKEKFIMEPFRMQKVYTYNNLIFINDSKSTSVSATNACLDVFSDRKRIIILGGISKNEKFSKLNRKIDDIVISYGKDKLKIFNEISDMYFDSLEDVIRYISVKFKKNKAYIILSPGCASFDQFSSYLDRGETFNRLIREYFEIF